MEDFSKISEEDQAKLLTVNVPTTKFELQRINLVRELQILDTEPDEEYNRLISLVARILKVAK